MTAKQKAAREKFKKVVAEAGRLRKKNPKLTQAQAVKQAWAISYSKEDEGGKLAEVGKVKKKATTKKAEKKQSVKKTAKVKAKKEKLTEMHTDTKSHNVNIRVLSGTGSYTDYLQVIEKINLPGSPIKHGRSMVLNCSKLIGKSTQSLYIRKAQNTGGLFLSQRGKGGTGAGDIAKLFTTKNIEVNQDLYKRIESLAKKANAFI